MGNQGGNAGNAGNQGRNNGNAGNQGGNDGNQGRNARKWGGGNEGNKRENLRTEVQLMNYNCGEGQETKNCVFRIIV